MEPDPRPADPVDQPIHPAPPRGKVALAVAGLTAFGFALPLVRILADAPEFFVAHRVSRAATLLYWAVVVLVVPGILALVALIPGAGGDTVRTVLLALLGGLAGASILQGVSGQTAVFTFGILGAAIAVPYAARRSPAFLDVLAVGSVGCFLLGGFVVGPSRTGTYLRAGSARAVASTGRGTAGPVVVIVFDEFPVSSLLSSDLRINRERFPNFAALAGTSDWFRLAASVSPNTNVSVPSLLSGVAPVPGTVPVASAYPTNLFLQLASRYEARSFESLTALCPPSVCASLPSAHGSGASEGWLSSLLGDSSVVLRHAIGTEDQRRHLPDISHGWVSFEDEAEVAPADAAADGEPRRLVFDAGTFSRESQGLLEVVEAKAATTRPQLRVAHITAPHGPWEVTPDGAAYALTDAAGSEALGGRLHWTGTEQDRRTGYQRMVLQVGALDTVLGRARAALEEQGLWDDATVVVTADHGTQFEPGEFRDEREGGVEVTGVPFFVKRPGQQRGTVDDRAALTIDLVPTVLGRIGLRSPSRFDGIDLYRTDPPPPVRVDAFVTPDHGAVTPDQRLDPLRALVRTRSSWIDPDGGWSPAYQPGVGDLVVGRPLADVGRAAGGSTSWHRTTGETGPLVTFDVAADPAPGPATVLLACQGEVVGAVALAAQQPLRGLQAFITAPGCAPQDLHLATLDAGGARVEAGPAV